MYKLVLWFHGGEDDIVSSFELADVSDKMRYNINTDEYIEGEYSVQRYPKGKVKVEAIYGMYKAYWVQETKPTEEDTEMLKLRMIETLEQYFKDERECYLQGYATRMQKLDTLKLEKVHY